MLFFHLSNPLKSVKCCIKPLNGHFPKYNLRFENRNIKSNTDKNKTTWLNLWNQLKIIMCQE